MDYNCVTGLHHGDPAQPAPRIEPSHDEGMSKFLDLFLQLPYELRVEIVDGATDLRRRRCTQPLTRH